MDLQKFASGRFLKFGRDPGSPEEQLIRSGLADRFLGGLGREEQLRLSARLLMVLEKTGVGARVLEEISRGNRMMISMTSRLLNDPAFYRSMTPDRFDAIRNVAKNLKDPAELSPFLTWTRELTVPQIRLAAHGAETGLDGMRRFMNSCSAVLGGYARLDGNDADVCEFVERNVALKSPLCIETGLEAVGDIRRNGGSQEAAMEAYLAAVEAHERRFAPVRDPFEAEPDRGLEFA